MKNLSLIIAITLIFSIMLVTNSSHAYFATNALQDSVNTYPDGSGGFVYRYTEADGGITWAWDANADGRFEKWKSIYNIPNQKGYGVFYWDWNQRGTPQGYAWAYDNEDNYFEKAWDGDGDGFFESFCTYSRDVGCVSWVSASTCNLVERKQLHTKAYHEQIAALSSGNTLRIKRAQAEYTRATVVLNACKYRMGG
ncbi:MAG: hypothetical protein SGI74_04300 [Oligoflexia bacterium]|nr:hypothetical protein [Oligoflexia bacterium]